MSPALEPIRRAEAKGVSKIFDRHRALNKIDLVLESGRVTALLGPNGSGKSTLLSLFSTLSTPTTGSMHFGSLAPKEAHLARGQVGLLSHHAMSYGELSALENVTFFARLHGLKDAENKAEELLVEFGLKDTLHKKAATFSRGMLQRVGLARALIGRPALVLLDEPFTGLDRASSDRVISKVKEIKNEGAMVLLISHDFITTAALADEAGVLLRGRLVDKRSGPFTAEGLLEIYTAAVEARSKTVDSGRSGGEQASGHEVTSLVKA